ncbi:SRPBCC family protein [Streptomyces albipurpureus]|uniref:SRPBCC family protein n=1 Tax=Streptomyces albipurpureus TaxID=2897419 RepID=A0ABT0UP32_9ACTN|nr:SRPBCC family protein [Streptomyces sp. CWNU-1]MCM2389855.1 SRPBCC family protein [Streptomyces sp. CWNU-1]
MARTLAVSDSIIIQAAPSVIYDQVSDPTLMGHWSPENLGATVQGGSRGAFVGMKFEGYNKRGPVRWTTRCTVVAADRGERFAFRVHAIGRRRPLLRGRIATWEYHFEAVEGGTRVTETWRDDRRTWPDAFANAFDKLTTRGHTFAEFQRGNIRRTLDKLKKAMEAAPTPS